MGASLRAEYCPMRSLLLLATLAAMFGRAGAFHASPFSHFLSGRIALRTGCHQHPPPRALPCVPKSGWRWGEDGMFRSEPPGERGGVQQLGMTSVQPNTSPELGRLSPMLKMLNKEQRAAVTTPLGPVIVLAGPGSGKTRVLTSRIGHMIDNGIPANEILAVTFTNKAAKEMARRVKEVVGGRFDAPLQVTVGTFHGVCVKILREFGGPVGVSSTFSIFSGNQQGQIMIDVMDELDMDRKKINPRFFQTAISKFKSDGIGHAEVEKSGAFKPFQLKQIQEVYERYEKELQRSNGLDFDDLLLRVVALLRNSPETRLTLQNRWKHVLVDEWQDTNSPQFDIARFLASAAEGERPSVFVVGDVDQSIYSFRGANHKNVGHFEECFKAEQLLLRDNYRSTTSIVNCAQSLIEKNTGRVSKTMNPRKGQGESVKWHEVDNAKEEGIFVAKEIKSLIQQRLVPGGYTEVAVMYRTNQQSRIMEEQFVKNGVPYYLVGATKFYERKEILDILAYLRSLYNPNDTASLLRIINVPTRGIGARTLERAGELANALNLCLWDAVRVIGVLSIPPPEPPEGSPTPSTKGKKKGGTGGVSEDVVEGVDAAMANMAMQERPSAFIELRSATGMISVSRVRAEQALAESGLTKKARASLLGFVELMELIRAILDESTVTELIDELCVIIGFRDYLLKDEGGDDRWRNVEELMEAGDRYSETGIDALQRFLEEVVLGEDLFEEEEIELDIDPLKVPKVKLMTLHSAKGLEFDTVFITGVNEDFIPHKMCASEDEKEEERRLLYVGFTRAKERLYVTWNRVRMSMPWNNKSGRSGRGVVFQEPLEPSRFLGEIPKDLREVISFDKDAVEHRISCAGKTLNGEMQAKKSGGKVFAGGKVMAERKGAPRY